MSLNNKSFAFLLAALAFGAVAQPEMPGGHPPVVAATDSDTTNVPPADPADVASLDAILAAYYDAISGAKGEERDWDRFRSLFQPDARLIAARALGEGGAGLWILSVEDFIGFNKNYFEKGGYFEREIGRRVETFGHIAQVWTAYESRTFAEQPDPNLRGVYSIQLLKSGDRWWIVNVYWDHERPGNPIPDDLLFRHDDESS